MQTLIQATNTRIIQDKKTVDWIVNNTYVDVFNPIQFEGYQRKVDRKHYMNIVKYLEKNFFLPTALICAVDSEYNCESRLRIVDGQHRIEALKHIKEFEPDRYLEISEFELTTIILEAVSKDVEIDTFITINKTSRKVDTSLALILKNKLNRVKDDKMTNLSKCEYISVELARKLNTNNSIWYENILYEGSTRNAKELITLNGFVIATRGLILSLSKANILNLDWKNNDELDAVIASCEDIISVIWNQVSNKWPNLFFSNHERNRVIQGTIGYSAINKFIKKQVDDSTHLTKENINDEISNWIRKITVSETMWEIGGEYSNYSSAAGHNIIAKYLCDSMN